MAQDSEMKCFNPEIKRDIHISSHTYVVNDKYYLIDFSAWDKEIRDWLANKERLTLGDEHMHAINYLRTTYGQHYRHPSLRAVTSELSKEFGAPKGTPGYFHTLFPKGIHQAYLVAGLPMQDSCC
ncbi:TusE/DsrC/DsvC family sulfur relay protein [Desulforhopalus sp. 52FAK]